MDGTRAVGAGNGVIGGIMPLRECRVGRASHGLTSSEAVSMQKPPTGEPYAGKPPVRFGGRGRRKPIPTPIDCEFGTRSTLHSVERFYLDDGAAVVVADPQHRARSGLLDED